MLCSIETLSFCFQLLHLSACVLSMGTPPQVPDPADKKGHWAPFAFQISQTFNFKSNHGQPIPVLPDRKSVQTNLSSQQNRNDTKTDNINFPNIDLIKKSNSKRDTEGEQKTKQKEGNEDKLTNKTVTLRTNETTPSSLNIPIRFEEYLRLQKLFMDIQSADTNEPFSEEYSLLFQKLRQGIFQGIYRLTEDEVEDDDKENSDKEIDKKEFSGKVKNNTLGTEENSGGKDGNSDEQEGISNGKDENSDDKAENIDDIEENSDGRDENSDEKDGNSEEEDRISDNAEQTGIQTKDISSVAKSSNDLNVKEINVLRHVRKTTQSPMENGRPSDKHNGILMKSNPSKTHGIPFRDTLKTFRSFGVQNYLRNNIVSQSRINYQHINRHVNYKGLPYYAYQQLHKNHVFGFNHMQNTHGPGASAKRSWISPKTVPGFHKRSLHNNYIPAFVDKLDVGSRNLRNPSPMLRLNYGGNKLNNVNTYRHLSGLQNFELNQYNVNPYLQYGTLGIEDIYKIRDWGHLGIPKKRYLNYMDYKAGDEDCDDHNGYSYYPYRQFQFPIHRTLLYPFNIPYNVMNQLPLIFPQSNRQRSF